MKFLSIIMLPLLFLGCEQYYRYPCQDPAKWETEECKKPICEVNRDCPELIFNKEKK